jgi:uncharacterized membrane protein
MPTNWELRKRSARNSLRSVAAAAFYGLLLLGCQGRDSAPQAESVQPPRSAAFRAAGTEPFWALDIDSTGLRFRSPDDTAGVHWPQPSSRVNEDTLQWAGRTTRGEIDASIWPGQCSDGMSDRVWSYTAAVRIDTTRYTGCAETRERMQRSGTREPPQP